MINYRWYQYLDRRNDYWLLDVNNGDCEDDEDSDDFNKNKTTVMLDSYDDKFWLPCDCYCWYCIYASTFNRILASFKSLCTTPNDNDYWYY
jgi:hypothetical protein